MPKDLSDQTDSSRQHQTRSLLRRIVDAIAWPLSDRPLVRREVVLAALALGVLALALYVRHVIRGGWYLDDWILVDQLSAGKDPLDVVRIANDITYRPGLALSLSLFYAAAGEGQSSYLAVGLVLAATESWLFYLVLRQLRLGQLPSAAMAVLFLALPWIDASRLWMAAFPIQVAGCLYLLGVLAALHGLKAHRRPRPLLWHGLAALLYLSAILTYELTVGLILVTPLLYIVGYGWRRSIRRGLSDYATVAVGLATIAPRAADDRGATTSVSFLWDRAQQIWPQAELVFRESLPVTDVLTGPLGLALALVGMVGVGTAIGARTDLGRGLTHWAAIASISLLFALAGLVMLLPADPYFIPRSTGLGNRVGAFAAPGAVVLIISLMVLVLGGVGTLVRRPRAGLGAAGLLVLVTILTLSIREIEQQDPWAESWQQQQSIVSAIHSAVGPQFPRGGAVVSFRHPLFERDDVSVFAYSWDLYGALWHRYRTPTAYGHPWMEGMTCTPVGVHFEDGTGVPVGASRPQSTDTKAPTGQTAPLASDTPYSYGQLLFVDVSARTAVRITDQARCQDAVAALTR